MRLYERYTKEIAPALKKELGMTNVMAVPKMEKVTLNVGLSRGLKEASFIEAVENALRSITGQQPVKTKAKQSISNFKIRQGMVIGMKVTLRGAKMYDFVEKLVTVTLPRVRDFRGLSPKIIDNAGNLNIGIKENIAFPEIRADEVDKIHGLQVTITTTAKNREQGEALLKGLGFPFIKK